MLFVVFVVFEKQRKQRNNIVFIVFVVFENNENNENNKKHTFCCFRCFCCFHCFRCFRCFRCCWSFCCYPCSAPMHTITLVCVMGICVRVFNAEQGMQCTSRLCFVASADKDIALQGGATPLLVASQEWTPRSSCFAL